MWLINQVIDDFFREDRSRRTNMRSRCWRLGTRASGKKEDMRCTTGASTLRLECLGTEELERPGVARPAGAGAAEHILEVGR